MVETSAKSRLIRDGIVIRSTILLIPCFKRSSATLNASKMPVEAGKTCKSLSFGITTSVSTYFLRFESPLFAFSFLILPSNENGLVTTATVRIPISLASLAITGAAPVPVPPPMPAAMKSKSVPLIASTISSLVSSADFSPTSGFEPAPRPLVSSIPIWIFLEALDKFKACKSVFTAINSAEFTCASIMLLTALFPPPPTPITFITAPLLLS